MNKAIEFATVHLAATANSVTKEVNKYRQPGEEQIPEQILLARCVQYTIARLSRRFAATLHMHQGKSVRLAAGAAMWSVKDVLNALHLDDETAGLDALLAQHEQSPQLQDEPPRREGYINMKLIMDEWIQVERNIFIRWLDAISTSIQRPLTFQVGDQETGLAANIRSKITGDAEFEPLPPQGGVDGDTALEEDLASCRLIDSLVDTPETLSPLLREKRARDLKTIHPESLVI